jgi:DNA-binding MarR family transcriptional regulator
MATERLDPTGLDIATLVMLTGAAAQQRITDQVHAAGFDDVRPAHGYVFQCLIDGQPTISEIARTLGMTQQGASKLVVDLEQRGYVSRVPDPRDNRARTVELTDRGRDCIGAARAARADLDAALVRSVGADEVGRLAGLLASLTEVLGVSAAIAGRSVQLPEWER